MAVATALAIGSLAVGAYGSYQQYRGLKEQQRTASNVTDFNARLEEQQAIQSDMEARENLRRMRKQAKRVISSQRAGFAGSGTLVNTGSPLEVQAESVAELERQALDQDRLKRLESSRFTSSAQSIRMGGNAVASGYGNQATGTLLGGATNLLGSGAMLYRTGAIG